jgi:2-polyprenyl-3-methyl-5-hydroxy-6-metoxy-1,4-benzoquinol methylase
MEKENLVKTYYDTFNLNRKGVYRNLRHYKIINSLFSQGLNTKSRVLEIGCGSGPISGVLVNYLKKGYFLGMDISPASINHLKNLFKDHRNADFVSCDIIDFQSDVKFDIIIMADVLEHIPIIWHEKIIQNLSENCIEGGKLIINIPCASLIRWQEKNEPSLLQIIDQPLNSSHVCSVVEQFNFVLQTTNKYRLFHRENDYEIFVFRKQTNDQEFQKINKTRIIIQKQLLRLIVKVKLLLK